MIRHDGTRVLPECCRFFCLDNGQVRDENTGCWSAYKKGKLPLELAEQLENTKLTWDTCKCDAPAIWWQKYLNKYKISEIVADQVLEGFGQQEYHYAPQPRTRSAPPHLFQHVIDQDSCFWMATRKHYVTLMILMLHDVTLYLFVSHISLYIHMIYIYNYSFIYFYIIIYICILYIYICVCILLFSPCEALRRVITGDHGCSAYRFWWGCEMKGMVIHQLFKVLGIRKESSRIDRDKCACSRMQLFVRFDRRSFNLDNWSMADNGCRYVKINTEHLRQAMDEEVLCKKALMPCAAKNIKRKNYNAAKSVSTSQNKNKKKNSAWHMVDHGWSWWFWIFLDGFACGVYSLWTSQGSTSPFGSLREGSVWLLEHQHVSCPGQHVEGESTRMVEIC